MTYGQFPSPGPRIAGTLDARDGSPSKALAPGLLYHIIARGNQRQPTFLGDADYRAYLHRLALYDTPLAKFMQGLQQSYTLRFNRAYGKVGHLFQGRYRTIVCESEQYLLTLVRYIHLNPVRAGLTARPEGYTYSGHRVHLTGRSTALLDPAPVLNLLGGSVAYARFVSDGLAEGHRPDFHPVERQPVLGNPAFVTDLAERVGQPGATRPREPLEWAVVQLAARLRIDPADVRGPDRGRALSASRALLAFLLVRRLAYRLTDVAVLLGRDPATLARPSPV